jgi:hypothetical protein
VTIEKNLISTRDGATVMRFFNQNTRTFEFDTSQTFNEPGNYALRSAIEQGVVELVKRGEKLGLWKYKEASNELVQKNSPSEGTVTSGGPQKQPSQSTVVEGNK